MEASLAAFSTGKVKACSDLGAAGIGAAVCESARYGGFGAKADLTNVPVNVEDITAEDEVLTAIRSKGPKAEVIAEITDDDKQIFEYKGKTIAVIPNRPSETDLGELTKET